MRAMGGGFVDELEDFVSGCGGVEEGWRGMAVRITGENVS